MKLRTVSTLPFKLDPKLVTTAIVALLAYLVQLWFGLELPEEVRAALSVLIGGAVAWFVPPALAVDVNAPDEPPAGFTGNATPDDPDQVPEHDAASDPAAPRAPGDRIPRDPTNPG